VVAEIVAQCLVLPILERMGVWISPHRRGWSW
jgi:hypothetical protein